MTDIIPREEWGAEPARWTTNQKRPVDHVFIHHGATLLKDHSQEGEAAIARAYQRYHFGKSWADIAYSFLIGLKSGRIYEARGWFNRPGATKNWNHRSYAICIIGDTTQQVISDEAVQAIHNLIKEGIKLGYILPDFNIRGHRDVKNKDCPGHTAYSRLQEMRPDTETVVVPKFVPPAFTKPLKLRWPRNRSPLVKWVQAVLGLPLNGDYGWLTVQRVKAWQKENGLKPDGIVGSITYNKMFGG
tara:strand:+ start:10639 stop:11370 length:732 start_codon:yes stop_codon:yes gene_type:complete